MYAIFEKQLIKRGVDLQSLDPQDKSQSGKQTKQIIHLKDGLDSDTAKKISKTLKESDLKVSVSIQGDKIRISDKKKIICNLLWLFKRKDIWCAFTI